MNQFINLFLTGIYTLKSSVLMGCVLYLIVLLALYVLNIRRTVTWKCVPELLLSVYSISLLKITGIFSLSLSLNGVKNYNLIPFLGSSIVPIFLNFLLFLPLGFLLPVVFRSCKQSVKRVVLIGGLLSLGIEVLQMFGGRYAEIDDLIINIAGVFSGYVIYSCFAGWKKNRKKALVSAVFLCLTTVICLIGIYLVGDHEPQSPVGLEAIEHNIEEINVYAGDKKQEIDRDAEPYWFLSMQLANSGGHIFEVNQVAQDEIWNTDDSFIEIIYSAPQTITFEGSESFEITDADRLLYNATENILFWGEGHYENSVDYAVFDSTLQEHSDQILEQYRDLEISIDTYFK